MQMNRSIGIVLVKISRPNVGEWVRIGPISLSASLWSHLALLIKSLVMVGFGPSDASISEGRSEDICVNPFCHGWFGDQKFYSCHNLFFFFFFFFSGVLLSQNG
jgi:hypothetical protein